MHTDVGTVLYLSFVAASICFAVTETRLFQRFREEIKRRNMFFGELVSCGYCLGHWVSGGLVVIYTPRLTRIWWPLDYLLARFKDQIVTTNISAGGDSCSLVTTLDDVAVGLLFAGSPFATIVNQIEIVRSLLRVEVAEQIL